MKSTRTIPIAIVAAGIIIAGAVYLSVPKTAPTEVSNLALVRQVSVNDHIFGNPSAQIILIEYGDFDCLPCVELHDTLSQIVATEGVRGDVAWIFRHFPDVDVNPNSISHARAAECAALVGGDAMFWKFAEALFMNQPVDQSMYGTLASKIGISNSSFAQCYAGTQESISNRILGDRQNALETGALSAPYLVLVNQGKAQMVLDDFSYDSIKSQIDQYLKR